MVACSLCANGTVPGERSAAARGGGGGQQRLRQKSAAACATATQMPFNGGGSAWQPAIATASAALHPRTQAGFGAAKPARAGR